MNKKLVLLLSLLLTFGFVYGQSYGGGGATSGGYYYANSTADAAAAPSHPYYEWIDISATGTSAGLTGDDQRLGPFPIGFSFPYFGTNYSDVYICTNGWISLGATDPGTGAWSNAAIPNTSTPNNVIYAYWDDMDMAHALPAAHAIYYGSTTDGRFVITYDHVPHIGASEETNFITFQVILYPDGRIKMQYREIGSTFTLSSCTIGLEGPAGALGVQYAYGTSATNYVGGPVLDNGQPLAVMFGTNPANLTDTPRGTISGTVRNATTNNPISGAVVMTGSYSATSDAQGLYTLANVTVGTYSVTASATGYTAVTTPNVAVTQNTTTTLNFNLTPSAGETPFPPTSLTGNVSGRNITLNWVAPAPTQRVLLGYKVYRNGTLITPTPITALTYNDNGLAVGTYVYRVTAQYTNSESIPTNNLSLGVTVTPVATVTGTVLNASTNQPIANVQVAVNGVIGQTNAQGLYTLSNVPAAANLTLSAIRDGFQPYVSPAFTLTDLQTYTHNFSMQVFTGTLPAPSGLTANVANFNNVILTWVAPTNTDNFIGYMVYRDNTAINATPLTVLTYTDTALPNGDYTYYVKALFAQGLSGASNSVTVNVNVPANMIPLGNDTLTNTHLPMEPYFNYSLTETIYLQSELNITNQRFSAIGWHYNGYQAWSDSIQVWMGHTQLTSFATAQDYLPVDQLTLVYAGAFSVLAVDDWYNIMLDTPFVYNNTDNLVIAVYKKSLPQYHSDSCEFFGSTVTGNRSMYLYRDSPTMDPYAPNFTQGTNGVATRIPNTVLYHENIPTGAQFAVMPASLNFDTTFVDERSVLKTVTVRNNGLGTLNITAPITVTGTDAASFSIVDTNTYPASITSGQSIQLQVRFTPVSAGQKTANLTITDNLTRTVHNVPLSGNAINATITTFPLSENFDALTPPALPTNWTSLHGTNSYAHSYASTASHTQPNELYLSNSSDNQIPLICALPPANYTGTKRVRFWAKGGTNYTLQVGTMTNRLDAATFTEIISLSIPSAWTEYAVNIPGGNHVIVAFKHGNTSTYQSIYIDDLSFENLPTGVPAAAILSSPADAATNVALEAVTFNWIASLAGGAPTGYRLNFGTNNPPTNIANNLDLGNVLTYTPATLTYATTYYWQIIPYNTQPATDCPIWSFTTINNPHYGHTGDYYYANSTTGAALSPSQPSYEWIDISATGTSAGLTNDDQRVGPLPIGFSFPYFGTNYTDVYICTNGWISIGATDPGTNAYSNAAIPNTATPNNVIYAYWDDMHMGYDLPAAHAIYYGAGDDGFVITYDHVPHIGTTADTNFITFQVILYPDGRIKMQYQEIGSTFLLSSCTIGLEGPSGTLGVQYAYGTSATNYVGGPVLDNGQPLAVAFHTDPGMLGGSSASIAGTITNTTSAPVANAQVSLTRLDNNTTMHFTTDATGHYEFLNLPLRQYRLNVMCVGYNDYGPVNFTVSDPTHAEVHNISLQNFNGPMNPPTNIHAQVIPFNTVVLTWDTPQVLARISETTRRSQNNLRNYITGYKIYRNGTLITPEPLTTNEYRETLLIDATYNYTMSTVTFQGETPQSAIVPVVITTGAGIKQIGIGTNTAQPLPMSNAMNYSYSQTLYRQEELNIANNMITDLYYHYTGNAAFTDNITIYMAHYPEDTLSGWLPITDFVQVYAGTITVPAGDSWINIILNVPFAYNNTDNLVVAFDENTPGNHGSNALFFSTNKNENRTFTYSSNTVNPDPSNITGGTASTFIPNTVFHFVPIASQPQITLNAQTLDFGALFIGIHGNKTLAILNTGTGNATINNIQLTGTNASEFSFTPPFSTAITLGTAQSHILNVVFTPTSIGNKTAQLIITDNLRQTHAVDITGSAFVVPNGDTILNPKNITFNNGQFNETGTTVGYNDDYDLPGDDFNDAVYRFTFYLPGTITVSMTGTQFASKIALYADDGITPGVDNALTEVSGTIAAPPTITAFNLEAGSYFLIVDGNGTEQQGNYQIAFAANGGGTGILPASNLAANIVNGNDIRLNWLSPAQGPATEFRYDDGTPTGNLGIADQANALLGSAFTTGATLSQVKWYLSSSPSPHSEVTVVILGLQANGQPDVHNVLHRSAPQPNIDNQWNTYTLPEQLTAPNGFFIGLNTPNYLALCLDDGVGAPFVFQNNTQFAITNWTLGQNNWLDIGQNGYQRNFLLRGVGTTMGAQVRDVRNLLGYNVYRNGVQANTQLLTATSYLDTNLPAGSYSYDVKAVYEEMVASPSNTVSVTIAINPPTDFASQVASAPLRVILTWVTPNSSREITQYKVYRDDVQIGQTAGLTYTDTNVILAHTYHYYVKAVYSNQWTSGPSTTLTVTVTGIEDQPTVPVITALSRIYPNPFNPRTTIAYDLAKPEKVRIEIFNILGQKVKTLVSQNEAAGHHTVQWEGRDDNNRQTASGIYFIRMNAGGYCITKKVILMK